MNLRSRISADGIEKRVVSGETLRAVALTVMGGHSFDELHARTQRVMRGMNGTTPESTRRLGMGLTLFTTLQRNARRASILESQSSQRTNKF